MEESSSSSSDYQFGDKDEQLLEQYLQQHDSERYPQSSINPKYVQLIFTHQQCQAIRNQVQFYLSPANLLDDTHIKKQLSKNKDKWLNISYLLKCNRISKMLREGYSTKQSDTEIELVVKGQSNRTKIRCLRKILQKSDGLIVRGKKVRSKSQIFHRDRKESKRKQGIEEQKKKQMQKEKGMNRREESRMLYIEIDSEDNYEQLIRSINKIDRTYKETQMIDIEELSAKKDKQQLSLKQSQISKKWVLIHCKTPKFREYLQNQVKQHLSFVVKLLDGFTWTKVQQNYRRIKQQINKYVT